MVKGTLVKQPKRRSRASAPQPQGSVFTRYVGKLDVKPRQQSRLSLGLFSADNPAKGFCVHLTPEPEDPESITSHIATPMGRMSTYELTLQITNYGAERISAEVWQM